MPESTLEFLQFARDLVAQAAEVILPIYEREFKVEYKNDQSPVTEADRAAERLIRAKIEERYPDHSILGEEYGESGKAGARVRWVIDPIDGTLSLTRRVPLFGSLIGVLEDGSPTVGVVHFPALGETAYAARGEGAYVNDRRAKASDCSVLSEALLCATGFHHSDLEDSDNRDSVPMGALLRAAGSFRGWGDCYGHILVASGRADVMVDTVMKPWDNAALVPILREAGAAVSAIDGRDDSIVDSGSLVSCAPGLHAQVLAHLATQS